MKRRPVLAFLLLSSVFCPARVVSNEEIARAVLRAVRFHPGMPNPDSVQVSNVVVTSEGVCLDYRVTNATGGLREGYAIYKTDKELVYIDNSWIWDSSCLVGKYGQRREGRDVTQAVSAAIEERKHGRGSQFAASSGRSANVQKSGDVRVETITVPVLIHAPAPSVEVTPQGVTEPGSSRVGTASRATAGLPALPHPPVASVSMPITESSTEPVRTPLKLAEGREDTTARPVEGTAPAAVVIIPAASVEAVATVAPVAASPVNAIAPAAAVQTGTIRGVTIADPHGALGQATPTAAGGVVQESLADAARRLKNSKRR
jgi:hypothetical protein